MGKKAPKTPAAPDPVVTAQAQTASNKETAIANARLNNVNQYTPYGSLIYNEIGTNADGTPKFESRTNLSPEQQQLLELQNQGDIGTSQLGIAQLGRITDAVSAPYSYNGLPEVFGGGSQEEAIKRAEGAINSRLDPQFARDEEALRTRLINQGIGQGSTAYQREFDTLNQAKNDARQQAILGGQQYGQTAMNESLARRQQAIQEYDTQRNAPLNEYSALTSGTQIQNPQFNNVNYEGFQSGDIQGAAQQAYQQQVNAANAKAATRNSNISGLGSFVGTAASLFSDIRLKQDITEAGEENGHRLYQFAYTHEPSKRYIGVMAQDVEKYMPEAVTEIEGFKAVNYAMLGLEMREVA